MRRRQMGRLEHRLARNEKKGKWTEKSNKIWENNLKVDKEKRSSVGAFLGPLFYEHTRFHGSP